MGKTVVSFRLDNELVGWVAEYAGDRGVPKTEVFEAALREYRDLCAGGVPDLPERGEEKAADPPPERVDTIEPEQSASRRISAMSTAERMAERDRILAEARASVVRRGS